MQKIVTIEGNEFDEEFAKKNFTYIRGHGYIERKNTPNSNHNRSISIDEIGDKLGIEFEANYRNRHARNCATIYAEKFGFTYYYDGAGDNPLEIVHEPVSLEDFQNGGDWLRIHEKVSNLMHEDQHHCGTHISICTRDIPTIQKSRILYLVNNLDSLGIFVACRKGSYNPYRKEKSSWFGRSSACTDRDNDRVEYRIFQSTPDYKQFTSYVEYVDATRLFCKEDYKIATLEQDLISFINDYSSKYPILATRIQEGYKCTT